MKKMKKVLLGIMAIVACLFISVSVNAANGKKVELKPNKTYKCDITGDGKLDKLKIKLTTVNQWNKNVDIYVNGKRVYKMESNWENEIYGCTAELITLKNKKPFLFISTEGVNAPSYTIILQYKKNRMKRVVDFENIYGKCGSGYADSITVEGNKIKVSYRCFSRFMGYIHTEMDFIYKDGTMKKASSTDDFIPNKKEYTARRNIKFYSKVGSKGSSFTLKKGQKVCLDKIRIKSGKCYYRGTSKGRRGWFTYNGKEYVHYPNHLFEEVAYAG